MKIVFVIRAPYGLMGTNASYMLPHYISKEHDVTVICPKPNRNEKDLIVFHDKKVDIIQINNGNPYERACEAATYIKDIEPDIVHVFSHPKCILYPLVYKTWQRNKKSPKWYLDIRSHIFSLTGLKLFKERFINSLLQFLFDKISATASKSYTSYFMLPLRKFIWSPIGTDIKEFPTSRKLKSKKTKFLFVGSIARVRQLDVLIEGFGKFLNETKDKKYTLDFYGSGNAIDELKQLVKERDWQKQITFKGALPFSDLVNKMKDYDAGFVFLPKDKFPYAPALKRLEYAAAKLDILESDTDWNIENPEGFKTFYFDNNSESIKECIKDYIASDNCSETLKNNYEKVQRFDWKYIYENDVKPIYQSLMKDIDNGNKESK